MTIYPHALIKDCSDLNRIKKIMNIRIMSPNHENKEFPKNIYFMNNLRYLDID